MKHTHAASDQQFEVLLESETGQAAIMTLDPGETTGGPDNRHEVTSDAERS